MKKAQEVSEQAGFRRFTVAVLIAFLIGILIRISLAPVKVEKLVRDAIADLPIHENLVFGTAEVSLADGPVPDLALVLSKVEWRLGGHCLDTAPVRAREVRIPLRWSSLFSGELAAGLVKIDELTVDLDDVKRDCGAKKSIAAKTVDAKPAANNDAVSETAGKVSATMATPGEVWSAENQRRIAKLVSGIRVTKAEVYFENRMKNVVIEDATAKWLGETLDVSTSLRFPPATVFGENLPTFAITGTVHKDEMVAKIRADLSEGALEANAVFKPVIVGGAKELNADIGLSFKDLPLSVVTPLLSKSKIVTGAFRPKFMWLDCNAEVKGIFSRLFIENPVQLSSCGISGQVGRVSFAQATRLPNGEWKPFALTAEKLDVARVLETFEIQGPSGVFANFGQVNADVKLNGSDMVELVGSLQGAVLRFAGGEGKALQPLAIGRIEAKQTNNRWNFKFADFKPEGGSADLTVQAIVQKDRAGHVAEFAVDLKSLKLNSRVEKVVFTGPVANISGHATITTDLVQSRLGKLRAVLSLQELQGSELAAREVTLEAQLKAQVAKSAAGQSDSEIELVAKAPVVQVLKTGHLFRLLQPALLGWEGEVSNDGKSLVVNRVGIKGRFHDNGFHWTGTNAGVGTVLNLTSRGSVFRDHAINAELEARFPLAARLKWNVSGNWMRPVFANASPELGALLAKAGLPSDSVSASVPPRLLGLPKER